MTSRACRLDLPYLDVIDGSGEFDILSSLLFG